MLSPDTLNVQTPSIYDQRPTPVAESPDNERSMINITAHSNFDDFILDDGDVDVAVDGQKMEDIDRLVKASREKK